MKKLILFLSVLLFACNTPYSLDKFKGVLNISKLQAPYSKYDPLYGVKYGKFKDVCNKYFYLQDNKYMTFFQCQDSEKEHKRSELRFRNDWKVSDDNAHILKANVKIFPLNQQREFTFLQIHADSTLKNSPIINKPLLRVTWQNELHNIHNHLWAVIRLGAGLHARYAKIDLGKKPKGFFNVTIKIKHSKISIWINNQKNISNFDVSYWNKFYNYFKAGVYLQGVGCSKILFNKLSVK
jgi:hypothetical protein